MPHDNALCLVSSKEGHFHGPLLNAFVVNRQKWRDIGLPCYTSNVGVCWSCASALSPIFPQTHPTRGLSLLCNRCFIALNPFLLQMGVCVCNCVLHNSHDSTQAFWAVWISVKFIEYINWIELSLELQETMYYNSFVDYSFKRIKRSTRQSLKKAPLLRSVEQAF